MRRVGLFAMLMAVTIWLAPAEYLALCAHAEQSGEMDCCAAAADSTPHVRCCEPGGEITALAPALSANIIAPAGAAAPAISVWIEPALDHPQAVAFTRDLPARPRPPAVLRI